MSKFDYPRLPRREIIGVLAESQIASVSDADLLNPTPDFISNLYTQILIHIGCLKEDYGLVEFADLEQLENPDLHVDSLNAEIAEFNELREKEMPLIQEVDTKVKELRQSISDLNNHQMSLKSTYRKMKDADKEMDEKNTTAEHDLVQSAQENASLRSKIVQSPDKLQRALEERKSVQVEAKNAERAAMQSYHEKTAILEVYTKASKKMTKRLKQMQTLQEQVNSAKQVEKDVKVLKVKNSDDGVLDKSLEAKLHEQQGREDQLEELLKQLEKERDLKCEEASKELSNVRSQVEYNSRGLEQRGRNVEALVAEGDAINEKINMEKESAAAKQQILQQKCEEIAKELFQYAKSTGQLLSRIESEAEAEAEAEAARRMV